MIGMSSTKKPKIDRSYFSSYAGNKEKYSRIYRDHSGIAECIQLFKMSAAPRLNRICVLGTATGEVCQDFLSAFRRLPYGCEINVWAYEHTPVKFKKRISNQDLRDYISECARKGLLFDLVFSNSFIYLPVRDISKVFCELASIARYVHFDSSFTGAACPDPYRQTLKPYEWWNQKFMKAGFAPMHQLWGERTYLWKNLKYSL